jgi:hypothetical protein
MAKRKRKTKWVMLYRKEKGNLVIIYEPLNFYQLKRKFREGWKKSLLD